MNILIVTNMFPPIQTGSSNYAVSLANTLHKHNQNVFVLTVNIKISRHIDNKYPFKTSKKIKKILKVVYC